MIWNANRQENATDNEEKNQSFETDLKMAHMLELGKEVGKDIKNYYKYRVYYMFMK